MSAAPTFHVICINKMLSSVRAEGLQTSMPGALGKPRGTVARVHIGQVLMSICAKLQKREHVTEVLYRAKFKFPGCQKVHISKKWGFAKFNGDKFENMVAESDSSQRTMGSNTPLIVAPWTNGRPDTHENLGAVPSLFMPTDEAYFLSTITKIN